jgi:hypothetical protein
MSISRRQALAVFTSKVHGNVAGVTTIKETVSLLYSCQGYVVTEVPAGAGRVASTPDLSKPDCDL